MKQKVALYGGAFDPIHLGHLTLAQKVMAYFQLTEIVFIPSGQSPHKLNIFVTPFSQRFSMVEIASLSTRNFLVSDIEKTERKPSFTIDTIKAYREKIDTQAVELYFIMGEDSLDQLESWKDYEDIVKMVKFLVVPRFSVSETEKKVLGWNQKYPQTFFMYPDIIMDISSTEIRDRKKTEIREKYLPKEILAYIKKYHLYEENTPLPFSSTTVEAAKAWLKNHLKPHRYAHSLSVAKEAVRLAIRYGENAEKAYTAGLLHDIAKHMDADEMKFYVAENHLEIPPYAKEDWALWHGYIGADMAKHHMGVVDNDMLHGIYYHTTGRAKMSLLEQIIFIADYTEPLRNPTEMIETARGLAEKSLSATMAYILRKNVDTFGNWGSEKNHDSYWGYLYFAEK